MPLAARCQFLRWDRYGHVLSTGDDPSLLARRYRPHGHRGELSRWKPKATSCAASSSFRRADAGGRSADRSLLTLNLFRAGTRPPAGRRGGRHVGNYPGSCPGGHGWAEVSFLGPVAGQSRDPARPHFRHFRRGGRLRRRPARRSVRSPPPSRTSASARIRAAPTRTAASSERHRLTVTSLASLPRRSLPSGL